MVSQPERQRNHRPYKVFKRSGLCPIGWAALHKTAGNQYGSKSGFELARSKGFKQKAFPTVRMPHQRGTFFKNA
jgi:hypothetical protein